MNPVIRATADWLAGTTLDYQGVNKGVNALLATTPRDGGDPAPPNVTVYDETRHSEVARRQVPQAVGDGAPSAPGLLVYLLRPADQIEPEIPGGAGVGVSRDYLSIPIVIAYAQGILSTKDGNRDAQTTIRTVTRSLAQFLRNENLAARTRNNWDIGPCKNMTWLPLWQEHGDTVLTCGLLFVVDVRDYFPL